VTGTGIKAGLYAPNFGAFADPRGLARLGAEAEAAGWEGLFVWDHTVRSEGDFDVADPWVALAAVAVATGRIALGPLVTPLPRRRPWNVAKAAVTLDHLSGGRVVLGVGLGSPRGPEFGPFGEETDLPTRGDLLDEGLAIVRAAWSGEPVHHRGAHLRVDGIRFLPRPVRPAGIPLWAATESTSGRAVRRAASCDGVFPIGVAPERLAELLDTVAAHRPGGDMTGYDVVTTSAEDDLGRWVGSGATWWLRRLPHDRPLAESLAVVCAGPTAP
jgi:alkanesulfonate monooxygenase SsuD/methylene tetrahydromethanopterin reductase-like flavin-dependent oxidoreductase (luciferase family)